MAFGAMGPIELCHGPIGPERPRGFLEKAELGLELSGGI
jgi:hypothetical protein